jgi:hypothetical protein
MALFTKEEMEKLANETKQKHAPMPKVSFSTPDGSWLGYDRNSILLYGLTKVGKTFAYCSLIEDTAGKGKKVFIINTDAGLPKTFKEYFKDKAPEVSKSLSFFPCFTTKEGISAVNAILASAKQGDLVVVDLLSDFWQMAQDEFLDNTGMSPDEYIKLASEDPGKFGLFSGSMWNYVKKLDGLVTGVLPKSGLYNILGVCDAKDIDAEKAIAKKATSEWDVIGFKPGGSKNLPYQFDSVVFVGGTQEKFFRVIGHRGKKIDNIPHKYGVNFWNEFHRITNQ